MQDKQGLEMTIELSETAVGKLAELGRAQPDKMLRAAVDSGGCHGLSYSFSMISKETLENEDIVFRETHSGTAVVVDSSSLPYINGCTVDYEQSFMRSAFVIRDNPQASSECGCGSSFDVKVKE